MSKENQDFSRALQVSQGKEPWPRGEIGKQMPVLLDKGEGVGELAPRSFPKVMLSPNLSTFPGGGEFWPNEKATPLPLF